MARVAGSHHTPSGRGADEIKNTGPKFAAIRTTGVWSSCDFRCYLDLRAGEAVDSSALLIQALGPESDDPDVAGKPSNPDDVTKRLRKRTPPPPMTIVEKQPPGKPAVARVVDDLSSVNSETSYTST